MGQQWVNCNTCSDPSVTTQYILPYSVSCKDYLMYLCSSKEQRALWSTSLSSSMTPALSNSCTEYKTTSCMHLLTVSFTALFPALSPSWSARVQSCWKRPSCLCMWHQRMNSYFTCMRRSSRLQPHGPHLCSSEVKRLIGFFDLHMHWRVKCVIWRIFQESCMFSFSSQSFAVWSQPRPFRS